MALGLDKDVCCHFDPLQIISNARKSIALPTYAHESKPKFENQANIGYSPQNDMNLAKMQVTKVVMVEPEFVKEGTIEKASIITTHEEVGVEIGTADDQLQNNPLK